MMERRPLTFLVPDGPGIVTSVDTVSAVGMAIVNRNDVDLLEPEWETSGVYILLGRYEVNWPPQRAGAPILAYVGKATSLKQRITSHTKSKEKEFWHKAVLIKREMGDGFSSAQASWLEGRLYELFDGDGSTKLMNKVVPGDKTLPSYETDVLEEAVIPPVNNLLRIMGVGGFGSFSKRKTLKEDWEKLQKGHSTSLPLIIELTEAGWNRVAKDKQLAEKLKKVFGAHEGDWTVEFVGHREGEENGRVKTCYKVTPSEELAKALDDILEDCLAKPLL